VDPAAGLAGGCGEHVHEGGHVVLGDALSLLHRLHGEGGVADRLELGPRGTTLAQQRRQLLAGGDLDLPPGLHALLIGPQPAELGTRVAGNHV
jgi:hypothetical protein